MTEAHILQLFGLIYLAVGLSFFPSGRMSKLLRSYTESPAATLFTGMGTVIIGYLLITFYGNWQGDWTTVLLTVFGWLGLIKGLLLLALPGLFDGIVEWVADHDKLRFASALVATAIGAITLAAGFGLL